MLPRLIVLALSFLVAVPAFAQAQKPQQPQSRARPATAADFTGVFRLLPVPLVEPTSSRPNPFPAACQYFGHYPDGAWLHQQQSDGLCVSEIPPSKPAAPGAVAWKLAKDGYVIIDRKEFKVQELWKVDRISGPSNLGGVNLNAGDLMMQLIDYRTRDIIWVRLLRRVGNAG